MNDEDLKLGGSIVLSGFGEVDGASMIVLKKIVGNHVRRITEITNNFENITLHLKKTHDTGNSAIFEIQAKAMDSGKPIAADVSDRNLFVATDSVLKKIINSIQK